MTPANRPVTFVAVGVVALVATACGTTPGSDVESTDGQDAVDAASVDVADRSDLGSTDTPAPDAAIEDAEAPPDCGCYCEATLAWARPVWTSFFEDAAMQPAPRRALRIEGRGDTVLASAAFSRQAWLDPLDPDGVVAETISLQSFLVEYGLDGAYLGPGEVGGFGYGDEIRAIDFDGTNTTLMTSDVVAPGCLGETTPGCSGSVAVWHYPGSRDRDWNVYGGIGPISGDALRVVGDVAWIAGRIAPGREGQVYAFGDGDGHTAPELVGGVDVYVARYVRGDLAAVTGFGTDGDDAAPSAVLPSTDGAALLWAGFRVGSPSATGHLARVGPGGEIAWEGTLAAEGEVRVGGAAVRPDGGFLVGAHTTGKTWFEAVQVLDAGTGGGSDAIVALDASGAFEWITTSELRGLSEPIAIDTRPDGSFVAVVRSVGPQCPGIPAAGSDIEPDIGILSFDAAGRLEWAAFTEGEGSDRPTGVVAIDGGAIVAGVFERTLELGDNVTLDAPTELGEGLVLFRVDGPRL